MRRPQAVEKALLFASLAIIVYIGCMLCHDSIFTHVGIYARLPKSKSHATKATGFPASNHQYPLIGAVDQLDAKGTNRKLEPCDAHVSNFLTKQVPPLIPDDIATLRTAVALVFDRTYMEASVDMAKSLRRDGGWEGDILMVFDGDRAEIANHLATLQFGLNRTTIFHPDDLLPQEARDSPMFNSSQVAKCRGETKVLRAKYLKASTISTTTVKERWHRILYVDSCHTIFTPDVDYFFTRINSKGILFVAPDPWRWAKEGLSSKLNTRCDKVAYNKLKADPLVSLDAKDHFNSALMLFDTSIIEASTVHEIHSVWRDYSSLMHGDQELQTIYWHYLKGRYRILPMMLPATDLIPYSFFRVRGLKYIMGAGHKTRQVCLKRPTNSKTTGF